MASGPDILCNYYYLLERPLSENGLVDKPSQIFNLDETGTLLDPSPPLVVAKINLDRRIHQQWDQETKHRSLF